MNRLSKSFFAVGGVVIAGCLLPVFNPQAVHALTAALVQVTNTVSNPVVSSELTLAPAQIVELYCGTVGAACLQVQPGGGVPSTSAYVVPDGKTFVITDVDIHTPIASYTGTVSLSSLVNSCPTCSEFASPLVYTMLQDGVTHHFSLTHGIAWPSAGTLNLSGTPGMSMYLHGYLASN